MLVAKQWYFCASVSSISILNLNQILIFDMLYTLSHLYHDDVMEFIAFYYYPNTHVDALHPEDVLVKNVLA